jgi:hypothetical protein
MVNYKRAAHHQTAMSSSAIDLEGNTRTLYSGWPFINSGAASSRRSNSKQYMSNETLLVSESGHLHSSHMHPVRT